jgi:hypothetical protein
VGETDVDTPDALMLAISQLPPLETTDIVYSRNDRDESARVTLSKAVPHGERIVTQPIATWRGLQVDFATAVEAYTAAARQDGVDSQGCVAVRHVEPHSPAWNAGLRAGSFISRINEHAVQTPREFQSLVEGQSGDVVVQIALPQNESQRVTVGDS